MTYKTLLLKNYLVLIGENYKSDKFPYYVVEKLTTGEYDFFQVDNPNDWDEKNQYELIAHLPLNGCIVLKDFPLLPIPHGFKLIERGYKCKQCGGTFPRGYDCFYGCSRKSGNTVIDYIVKTSSDDEIDNLGKEYYKKNGIHYGSDVAFSEGYRMAKKTFNYTKEDLIRAWAAAKDYNGLGLTFEDWLEKYSQIWLNGRPFKRPPSAFNCEIDVNCSGNDGNGCFMDSPGHNCGCVKPKTITSPEGHIQLVGNWIY
jgi:hypothetical protein